MRRRIRLKQVELAESDSVTSQAKRIAVLSVEDQISTLFPEEIAYVPSK